MKTKLAQAVQCGLPLYWVSDRDGIRLRAITLAFVKDETP